MAASVGEFGPVYQSPHPADWWANSAIRLAGAGPRGRVAPALGNALYADAPLHNPVKDARAM